MDLRQNGTHWSCAGQQSIDQHISVVNILILNTDLQVSIIIIIR